MKRAFLFWSPVLILGLVLGLRLFPPSSGTETDYPSALMWDDTLYYASAQEADKVPAHAVVGTVSSETDTFPRKNGQANFCPPGTPVAEAGGGMAVQMGGVWYLCRPEEAKRG